MGRGKLSIEDGLFDDTDFYSGDGYWDVAVDDGSMSPREAAFMRGWDDAG